MQTKKLPAGAASIAWLLVAPHRLFFFLAMCGLVAASLWWWLQVGARSAGVPFVLVVPPAWVHGWSMLAGFLPFFMFGFLFTAGPRWLHVQPPAARELALPGAVALVGVALVLTGAHGAPTMIVAGALTTAAGWSMLLARFARLLRASRVDDQVHARVVFAFFVVGVAAQLAYAIGIAMVSPAWVHSALMASTWFFIAPIYVTVAHRLIPFFTANVVPRLDVWHPLWLLVAFNGVVIAHGLLPVGMLVLPGRWVAVLRLSVDLAGGALLVLVAWRWGVVQSASNRLLAMLHLGFVWLALALLLAAWQQAITLLGLPAAGLGLAPLHALTMGFFGSVMLAMVTRVTAGHGGRALVADALTWLLFWLLQLAVLLRVAADAALAWAPWLTLAAVSVWCVALVWWAARLVPIYLRPRADGRPG